MTRRLIGAVGLALAVALTLCVGADAPLGGAVSVAAPRIGWHAVSLPTGGDRAVVREVVRCGDRWAVLGALVGAGGDRPAAWTGGAGGPWRLLPMRPVTYYGRQHTLYAGGCRNGRLAALGAAYGGAHAMPRTSTWYQRPDGAMVEVRGAPELYGGPSSMGVTRIVGGPAGWLVVGDWVAASGTAGAAVWSSPDGVDFRRLVDDPALSSGSSEQTTAADAVAGPAGWTVVGSRYDFAAPTLTRTPVVWGSPDGTRWRREPVRAAGAADAVERVTAGPGGPVAVGASGTRYAAWGRSGGTWVRLGRFGLPGGHGNALVQGLTSTRSGLLATVPGDGRLGLWASGDGRRWAPVATPGTASSRGETRMLVAGAGDTVLLAVDTGRTARIWLGDTAAARFP